MTDTQYRILTRMALFVLGMICGMLIGPPPFLPL